MANKKKITTGIIAGVTAVALAIGGTFAWQSISQTALNEKEAVINPGGRLHDDFNGTNKDVYVENFADDEIFARVRLDEYFEIVMNKGTGAEKTQVVTTGADKEDVTTYITHKFDAENATDDWWNWTTGGSTVYMPTFNKNKDSLKADVNGTMDYTDAEGNAKPYGDYVEYTEDQEVTANATYDNDSNSVEDENVTTVEETHKGTKTGSAKLISMEDWLALESDTDNYWVYDTDGWVYYSSPIKSGTATGLLLDGISLNQVMDDSYYYAINVVGQFITADDLGKDDNTGFYADGETVSNNALTLLKKIGVDVGEIYVFTVPEGDDTYRMFTEREDDYYDLTFFRAKRNLTQEEAQAAANSIGLGNVAYYTTTYTTENEYTPKAVSVRFANKVYSNNLTEMCYKLGTQATVEPTIDFTNLDVSSGSFGNGSFAESTFRELDLSPLGTLNLKSIYHLFSDCEQLEKVTFGDFDTSQVDNMSGLFEGCTNLKEINFGKSFTTKNVKYISSMFKDCPNLVLDCSDWDVTNVTSNYDFNENSPGVTAPNWVN